MPRQETRVLAYVLPGKPDNSTKAWFTNSNRAEQYAKSLIDSGDYSHVAITSGLDIWTINKAGESSREVSDVEENSMGG
jgi:hypothetical protein